MIWLGVAAISAALVAMITNLAAATFGFRPPLGLPWYGWLVAVLIDGAVLTVLLLIAVGKL